MKRNSGNPVKPKQRGLINPTKWRMDSINNIAYRIYPVCPEL